MNLLIKSRERVVDHGQVVPSAREVNHYRLLGCSDDARANVKGSRRPMMHRFRKVALASALLLCGCGSNKVEVGNESDGFPLDYGSMQDFKISFPIKIVKKSEGIDLNTTIQVRLETLSSDMCKGVDGCSFVKRETVHIDEAGNFLTGSFAGIDSVQTVYFKSDGSSIRSTDSDSVTCSTLKSTGVRGQFGDTLPTDEENCSDGRNLTGLVKVFRYNSDLAEVTSEVNGGQYRTTMLVDRQGNLKGMAISAMELGVAVQGSSYRVQNPTIN